MIKGKTKSGFEFAIEKKIVSDWNTIEIFAELDEENPFIVVKLCKKLLGNMQYKALKKHCGWSPFGCPEDFNERMFKEMNEILSFDTVKN